MLRCAACTVHQTQANRTPLEPVANKATSPYDVAVDLTGPSDTLHGNTLLTIIDFYSRYPEVIEKLSRSFSKFGLPRHLVSDNGSLNLLLQNFKSSYCI